MAQANTKDIKTLFKDDTMTQSKHLKYIDQHHNLI